MNPLLPFLVILIASLGAALLRGWPLTLSIIEAIAFASGMTLVFFGEAIPIGYTPKAILIVLAVLVSTWAFGRITNNSSLERVPER